MEELVHLLNLFSTAPNSGMSLVVHGMEVIPKYEKKLTKRGEVSEKKIPRARFHEIYQDYVCGCMLRIVREVFGFSV